MVIDFSNLDLHDRPTLILKNAGDVPLGVIGCATDVELEGNYNEISILSFKVPAHVDRADTTYYDDVIGMRVIEIPELCAFTLTSPEEHDDGVYRYKECKAYSLEYEFSYKKITMAKDTYKFWSEVTSDQSNTVLGMIMELMPAWHVERVSASLINKYRTFEINNENVYNFIKSTVQQSFGCIFDFDTLTRGVTVRDVEEETGEQPVYLSTQNLLKAIVIHEDVENMVTRLDVNGADGVDIRDVNPTGTNKIINLDYYMNTKNFSQALIDKYNAWSSLVQSKRKEYYTNSINHTLAIMKVNVARAHLADLQGELTDIDNQRGIIIQAISQGIEEQSALTAINAQYAAKEQEIRLENDNIAALEALQEQALSALTSIVNQCSFEKYFTAAERGQLDRYIRDGEVTEASFVSTTVVYSDAGVTATLSGKTMTISNAQIEVVTSGSSTIYDIRGGKLVIDGHANINIISGVLSYSSASGILFTASLGLGAIGSDTVVGGSVTINAPNNSVNTVGETGLSIINMYGYMLFSLNPSEYQRRSVAWDLYEYGESLAEKLAQPTFTFSIESANFLALEEFESFKNHLKLGQRIYLDTSEDTLKPICVGVRCLFNDLSSLTLKFSDSYVQSDTSFKLADLLEKSVSMGRTVEAGKFNYEEFADSGAKSSVREFMNSALDVSKNKILSSKDQAISWDNAGMRFRKWANEAQTAYEDEQIWMNNNSVMMTDDGWQTAKMAIGKIFDQDTGSYLWGLVAEMVVGRLIAGESLIIESAKTDGTGASVFRVDEDGCRIVNGDLQLISEQGTLRSYLTNSDGIKVFEEMSTSSTALTTLDASSLVVVSEVRRDTNNIEWGYCITDDGNIGWIQLANCTYKKAEIGQRHIVIHPDIGIAIGKYPVAEKDSSGHYRLNSDNSKFWVDSLGNVYMTGAINATSLYIHGNDMNDIDNRVDSVIVDDTIYYLATSANSGVTRSTQGWTTTIQTITSTNRYLWTYHKYTYGNGDDGYTDPIITGVYGNHGDKGDKGDPGDPSYAYNLSCSPSAVVRNKTGAITPNSISFSATRAQGTGSPSSYAGRFVIEEYNGTTWTTKYTSSSNESNHSHSPSSTATLVRATLYLAGGTSTQLDVQTVPIVTDGTDGVASDGYTVMLTNESHTFAAGTSAAVASSTTSQIIAYKGSTRMAATIGSITGAPTGMTTSLSQNGTTSASFTVAVTTSLTTQQGILNVPVTVDGKVFNLTFSWALALTGKSISSVQEYYAITNSTSTPADSSFSTNVVMPTATNRYLWNYELITYSGGGEHRTDKRIIGTYGIDGTNGMSITAITNYYLASASNVGIDRTSSGWTEQVQSVSATKKYLWNYERITRSNGGAPNYTYTTPCIIGVYGDSGADGVSVGEVVPLYYASNTNTTPAEPLCPVTRNDAALGVWTKALPALTEEYQYLFTCDQVRYDDGEDSVYGPTDIVLNNATSSIHQRTTPTAIGNIVEQKASVIRMISDTLMWHSTNSELDEDGTLTIRRAIMDGPLSGILNKSGVRNGILIGNAQIVGVKNGVSIFDIAMPYSSTMPISGATDDTGQSIQIQEEPLEEIEYELGDYTRYQPNVTDTNSVKIAVKDSSHYMQIGSNNYPTIVLGPNGEIWLFPYAHKLYTDDHKTKTGAITVGNSKLDIVNGLVTESSGNSWGITQDVTLTRIYNGLEQDVVLSIKNGIITDVTYM